MCNENCSLNKIYIYLQHLSFPLTARQGWCAKRIQIFSNVGKKLYYVILLTKVHRTLHEHKRGSKTGRKIYLLKSTKNMHHLSSSLQLHLPLQRISAQGKKERDRVKLNYKLQIQSQIQDV
ncbi:unnamed protein product [Lepidochelys kempii]